MRGRGGRPLCARRNPPRGGRGSAAGRARRGAARRTRPRSVERELLLLSCAEAGIPVVERPILRVEVPLCDELFSVDHRGITALGRCDGHPLMSLVAERAAAAMERTARRLGDTRSRNPFDTRE